MTLQQTGHSETKPNQTQAGQLWDNRLRVILSCQTVNLYAAPVVEKKTFLYLLENYTLPLFIRG